MKEQFVTYEIALALKELGFDEECLVYFNNDKYRDLICTCENGMDGDFTVHHYSGDVNAPLWQQVIDWFREKYEIYIAVISYTNYIKLGENTLMYEIIIGNKDNQFDPSVGNSAERLRLNYETKEFSYYYLYKTYEEAREQAILKAIELCQKEK